MFKKNQSFLLLQFRKDLYFQLSDGKPEQSFRSKALQELGSDQACLLL